MNAQTKRSKNNYQVDGDEFRKFDQSVDRQSNRIMAVNSLLFCSYFVVFVFMFCGFVVCVFLFLSVLV
jgi:hypothetical protein